MVGLLALELAVWPLVALKSMLAQVRNPVLLVGWRRRQFEQPTRWSLDSSS